MLRNFWYAVELSSAVTRDPRAIKALGQTLLLYRRSSDNEVVAMSNWCTHRRADLSKGVVEGDCIRCPYHAWKFAPDGQCVDIPAHPGCRSSSMRFRLQTFPVQERYGWVWIFIGDITEDKRPPLPILPEFHDGSLRAVEGEFKWRSPYSRAVENSIDVSHVPFVHNNTIGHRQRTEVPPFKVRHSRWGAESEVRFDIPRDKRWAWRFMKHTALSESQICISFGFYMPHITRVAVLLGSTRLVLYAAHLPIDEQNTVTKWIALRSFLTGRWADSGTRRRVLQIYRQDQLVVESQLPLIDDREANGEAHVASDAVQIAYRKLRRRCLDLGWQYDLNENPCGVTASRQHEETPSRFMTTGESAASLVEALLATAEKD